MMTRWLARVVLVLLLLVGATLVVRWAGAQQLNTASTTQVYQPLGYAQVAAGGLTSAVPLPSIPAGARVAQICVEAQAVRYRDDGVAPTAAIGMPIASGGCVLYSGQLSAVLVIQQTVGAILDVSYYR
jgi:hypothetical protein